MLQFVTITTFVTVFHNLKIDNDKEQYKYKSDFLLKVNVKEE